MASSLQLMQTAYNVRSFVEKVGSDPRTVDGDGKVSIEGSSKSDRWITKLQISLVGMIAIATFFCGGLSFFGVSAVLADIASLLVMAGSVVCVVQKLRLRKLGSFRSHHNQMRAAINTMHVENTRLTSTVDRLEQHTGRLATVQQELEVTAERSGAQVDRLLEICQENAEIQAGLRKHLQTQVVQQIMKAIMDSDQDRNFTLQEGPELNQLMVRLSNLPSVEFDRQNFLKQVSAEPTPGELQLTDVINLARTLNDDLVDPQHAVFRFSKKVTAA